MTDLLVAGGGPAGLAIAITAPAPDWRSSSSSPRGAVDKACGEGLMPAAVRELRRLGVTPTGAVRGHHLLDGQRRARRFPLR